MYPGHYALGLALHARQKDDRLSVVVYFLVGAQLNDLLWTMLTLAGIEGGHSMGSMAHHEPLLPWSHSLVMHLVWAAVWGCGGGLFFRSRAVAGLGAINVAVHFVLDWAVEDMPLIPLGEAMVHGPGLYDRGMVLPFVAESLFIVAMWWAYHRTLQSRAGAKRASASWAALALMLVLHVLLFVPTFQGLPAVDLSAEPNAVLGYTFFLVLGVVLLAACHRWATHSRLAETSPKAA